MEETKNSKVLQDFVDAAVWRPEDIRDPWHWEGKEK